MLFKDLFRGKNLRSRIRLKQLSSQLGDNPKILWYPSCRNDLRDLMEFSEGRARKHQLEELPDIFFHTDCEFEDPIHYWDNNVFIHNDRFTTIKVIGKYELELLSTITYFINPLYSTFQSQLGPKVFLFDLEIVSHKLGHLRKTMIYFLFENINFLDEVILKNNLKLSHIVKLGEGMPNLKPITLVLNFLSKLETKYIAFDGVNGIDNKIAYRLKKKHELNLKYVEANFISEIENWSSYHVKFYKIQCTNFLLTPVLQNKLIKTIFNKRN